MTSASRRTALIVAAAFFMQGLDGAIINSSMPQMAASFGVEPTDLSIGITAYLLATAAVLPLGGWLADRFGARRVFAAAIVVFTLASLACGLSPDLVSFTVARTVQGIGGALMAPVGRAVVLRNASKAELMAATAVITWPALTAPVLGPALGGFITTWASWHWNFLLNVPLGVAGFALVLAFIPDTRPEERMPLDRPGFLLSATALVLLLYGLEAFAHAGSDWRGPALLTGAGLAVGAAAVWHLRRTATPLLDLTCFSAPTFAATTLTAGTLCRIAVNATPFLLPLLFQIGFGFDAWQAGLMVLVYFAGNLGMKPVTTPILRRWGFRRVLVVNGVLSGAAILACGFLEPGTPMELAVPILFAAGLTRSMQFTAQNTLTFADIGARQRAAASTLSSVSQQVSTCLGVALAAFLLDGVQALRGLAALPPADFRFAFGICGAVGMVGALLFLRLQPHAGGEVSGHRAN